MLTSGNNLANLYIGWFRPPEHSKMQPGNPFKVLYLLQSGLVNGVMFDIQQGLVVLENSEQVS